MVTVFFFFSFWGGFGKVQLCKDVKNTSFLWLKAQAFLMKGEGQVF
jgi:hypothetical protein